MATTENNDTYKSVIKGEPKSPSPPPSLLKKRRRRYREYKTRIQNIVDPYTFHTDQSNKLRHHGTGPILRRARHILLQRLQAKDYKTSLALLAGLIDTTRFTAVHYWKVGQEIFQHLYPTALVPFLESVVSGIRKKDQLEALTACLLEIHKQHGYDAFQDRIHELPDADDNVEPMIAKLVALVTYEEWRKEKDQDRKTRLASQTYALMKLVFSANVKDRHVVKAYLEILSAQEPRPEEEIKEVVERSLRDTRNDPEFLSILLHYGSKELPDLILSQSNFCDLDPVADARISFVPLITKMKSVSMSDPYFFLVTLARTQVITVRLDYGCVDTWTLEELDILLGDLRFLPKDLAIRVCQFLSLAGVLSTLNRLQMTTDDVITMDILEFLKYKLLRINRKYIPVPMKILTKML